MNGHKIANPKSIKLCHFYANPVPKIGFCPKCRLEGPRAEAQTQPKPNRFPAEKGGGDPARGIALASSKCWSGIVVLRCFKTPCRHVSPFAMVAQPHPKKQLTVKNGSDYPPGPFLTEGMISKARKG
jgi:hypothetical protein